MPLWGCDCSLQALAALACLSPEGDGLQLASSVQPFILCAGLAVSQGFSRGSYPTVLFASPNYFAQIGLRVFRPDPYSKRCSPRSASLPSPCLLVACAGICAASPLGQLPQGSQSAGFNCLFIFPPCYVALCASKAWHRFGSEKVSWCLETSLFLRLPSWDGTPSLPLLSLFLSFIFFPTSFSRLGLLFWVPDVLCQHLEVVLWNLLGV